MKISVGLRHPALHEEGRFAIVTRRKPRDAMDAWAHWTSAPARTVKSCGRGPPTLGSSPWTIFTGDGGKKARFTGESTK